MISSEMLVLTENLKTTWIAGDWTERRGSSEYLLVTAVKA